MNKNNNFLTTKESAEFLRISSSTIYRMEKLGLIMPYKTPGGQRRFALKDLKDYLKRSKKFKFQRNCNSSNEL